jgi:hypothetical protein
MTLRDVQRILAALVGHQVLDLACAPNRKQANLAVVAFDSTQTPQRIVEAIAVEDLNDADRLIVGLGLVQRAQQLRPAFVARRVFADLV